ncbi:MAG: hypothetical protein ACJ780_16900 [Solirubrobacteraceae bacterium]
MSDEPEPGVIGSLPRTRPHRRSTKRAAPAGAAPPRSQGSKPVVVKTADGAVVKTADAAGASTEAPPAPQPSPGALETAVQAAAELAEIGLHAGARALRHAITRLPRP